MVTVSIYLSLKENTVQPLIENELERNVFAITDGTPNMDVF